MEYKLTRFAKMNTDQNDAIRSDIRELKRSMQNIESENIKIENAMKQLQTDVSDLREIVDADRRELKIDFQQNIFIQMFTKTNSLHSN